MLIKYIFFDICDYIELALLYGRITYNQRNIVNTIIRASGICEYPYCLYDSFITLYNYLYAVSDCQRSRLINIFINSIEKIKKEDLILFLDCFTETIRILQRPSSVTIDHYSRVTCDYSRFIESIYRTLFYKYNIRRSMVYSSRPNIYWAFVTDDILYFRNDAIKYCLYYYSVFKHVLSRSFWALGNYSYDTYRHFCQFNYKIRQRCYQILVKKKAGY